MLEFINIYVVYTIIHSCWWLHKIMFYVTNPVFLRKKWLLYKWSNYSRFRWFVVLDCTGRSLRPQAICKYGGLRPQIGSFWLYECCDHRPQWVMIFYGRQSMSALKEVVSAYYKKIFCEAGEHCSINAAI